MNLTNLMKTTTILGAIAVATSCSIGTEIDYGHLQTENTTVVENGEFTRVGKCGDYDLFRYDVQESDGATSIANKFNLWDDSNNNNSCLNAGNLNVQYADVFEHGCKAEFLRVQPYLQDTDQVFVLCRTERIKIDY